MEKGLLVYEEWHLNFLLAVVYEFQQKEHVCYLNAPLYTLVSQMFWLDFIQVRIVPKIMLVSRTDMPLNLRSLKVHKYLVIYLLLCKFVR